MIREMIVFESFCIFVFTTCRFRPDYAIHYYGRGNRKIRGKQMRGRSDILHSDALLNLLWNSFWRLSQGKPTRVRASTNRSVKPQACYGSRERILLISLANFAVAARQKLSLKRSIVCVAAEGDAKLLGYINSQ